MASDDRSRRGAEAVEFAIILPVLLTILLGAVDLGRLMWSNTVLAHAAEAAARCAAVNTFTCGSTTATQAYGVSQAWGLSLTSSAFAVTTPACGAQVVGTMTFNFVVPWLYVVQPFGASNAMTLTATSCYPT
jgi:Flp pilus assembly protein TadG